MKKNELKKVLKPLIKECVKECILEEGVLSGIIKEVATGLSVSPVVTESIKKDTLSREEIQRREEKYETQRQEKIRRLNESTKMKVDLFQDTRPIPDNSEPGNALAGLNPTDQGVDISGILNLAGNKWKNLI